jgi:hypothetical protein
MPGFLQHRLKAALYGDYVNFFEVGRYFIQLGADINLDSFFVENVNQSPKYKSNYVCVTINLQEETA